MRRFSKTMREKRKGSLQDRCRRLRITSPAIIRPGGGRHKGNASRGRDGRLFPPRGRLPVLWEFLWSRELSDQADFWPCTPFRMTRQRGQTEVE